MRYTAAVVLAASAGLFAPSAWGAFTNNILITGYWPPTNEMVRRFSTNSTQNPSGWIGGNWEGRGYNIHSFFPEFPGQSGPNWGKGEGDFEVDYQDTAADWARIVAEVKPVAIITFSRDLRNRLWKFEPAAQRFRLPGEANPDGRNIPFYINDYDGNRLPTDVPIANEAVGNYYRSTLPMQQMYDAIDAQFQDGQLDPFIPLFDPVNNPDGYNYGGAFLSGYMSYLGTWYQQMNAGPDADFQCFAAGHIHVGQLLSQGLSNAATLTTLRTLTSYLDTVVPGPGGVGLALVVGLAASRRRR